MSTNNRKLNCNEQDIGWKLKIVKRGKKIDKKRQINSLE